jgi:hypothetical protein
MADSAFLYEDKIIYLKGAMTVHRIPAVPVKFKQRKKASASTPATVPQRTEEIKGATDTPPLVRKPPGK